MIGIGLDSAAPNGTSEGVGGILIANKKYAHGLTIRNQSSIINPLSYGLYLIQESMAPLVYGYQIPGTAELVQLQASSGMTNEKLLSVVDKDGVAGVIASATGELNWNRPIRLFGQGVTRPLLHMQDNSQAPATQRNYSNYRYNETEFLAYSGTDNIFYPRKIGVTSVGQGMALQTAPNITDISTVPVYSKQIEVQHSKIGFYGATPAGKQGITGSGVEMPHLHPY
jgi:hypothetical protein